jgi:hypothetical protein
MEKTSADENCLVSSILFLVASLEETSWEAGGVVEELRLACCGVVEAEGPRLAVALSRGRVLVVAEQGQCVLCVNRAESKYEVLGRLDVCVCVCVYMHMATALFCCSA